MTEPNRSIFRIVPNGQCKQHFWPSKRRTNKSLVIFHHWWISMKRTYFAWRRRSRTNDDLLVSMVRSITIKHAHQYRRWDRSVGENVFRCRCRPLLCWIRIRIRTTLLNLIPIPIPKSKWSEVEFERKEKKKIQSNRSPTNDDIPLDQRYRSFDRVLHMDDW